MPHVPRDFRTVPQDVGAKAPLVSGDILDKLPVSEDPPAGRKPEVPVAGRPRERRRYGLERISLRSYGKSPEEIIEALSRTDLEP